MILTIDLETYSPQDIGKVGAYRYAQDPDFEILLALHSLAQVSAAGYRWRSSSAATTRRTPSARSRTAGCNLSHSTPKPMVR